MEIPELCDCPECGLPAVVTKHLGEPATPAERAESGEPADHGQADEIVRIVCIMRHWFLGPRERLVT